MAASALTWNAASARGITWNAASARGITWNAAAGSAAVRRVWRQLGVAAVVAALSATVAGSGIAVVLHRSGLSVSGPVGVGANPWFADPSVSPTGAPTLPDLASVEQVVGAPQAWASGATGRGVDVAVLDSGVTPVPGLDSSNKVVYGPDLSFDSQDPNTAYLDGFGHGTSIASIIAGNDGTPGGFQGVAPDARIVSVKVGATNGAVDVSQMIAGIDWVVQHANDPGMNIRVLNLSLGTDALQAYQVDPLAHAAEAAWRHGIVVVAAVGNAGTSTKTLADPASDPYVLAVGAEDPAGTVKNDDDFLATYSNGGNDKRHPDVVAPGSYVIGLRAPGSTLDTQFPGARIGDRFFRGSGTSQAAAVVSGAVADLLSARPGLTADQVKKLLVQTAHGIKNAPPAVKGVPSPPPPPGNAQGDGLINVRNAVAASIPKFTQTFTAGDGSGSLEGARGTSHVSSAGITLTGEQDIFGNPWSAAAIGAAEEAGATWSGGTYNGATWSGATWSGATWSGATWSGATWSGATWSGATWSGATWSSATWSGATWSSGDWS
jgi:serine protease AprX